MRARTHARTHKHTHTHTELAISSHTIVARQLPHTDTHTHKLNKRCSEIRLLSSAPASALVVGITITHYNTKFTHTHTHNVHT